MSGPTRRRRPGVSVTDGPHLASPEDIRSGRVSRRLLPPGPGGRCEAEGENPVVVAEVRAASLPRDWPWAVLGGLDEVVRLLDGRPSEGPRARGAGRCPREACSSPRSRSSPWWAATSTSAVLETALLGLLCQASGVATMAARCRLAAGDRPVYSFGARRMHPADRPDDRAGRLHRRMRRRRGTSRAPRSSASSRSGPCPTRCSILGEERAWRALRPRGRREDPAGGAGGHLPGREVRRRRGGPHAGQAPGRRPPRHAGQPSRRLPGDPARGPVGAGRAGVPRRADLRLGRHRRAAGSCSSTGSPTPTAWAPRSATRR